MLDVVIFVYWVKDEIIDNQSILVKCTEFYDFVYTQTDVRIKKSSFLDQVQKQEFALATKVKYIGKFM